MMKLDDSLRDKINNLIDKYTGEELWQEAVKLAIKSNPKIAREVYLTLKENRAIRENLKDQKFATSKTKSMRLASRVPRSIDEILTIVDPETFPIRDENMKKDVARFKKAFPEFFIPESV